MFSSWRHSRQDVAGGQDYLSRFILVFTLRSLMAPTFWLTITGADRLRLDSGSWHAKQRSVSTSGEVACRVDARAKGSGSIRRGLLCGGEKWEVSFLGYFFLEHTWLEEVAFKKVQPEGNYSQPITHLNPISFSFPCAFWESEDLQDVNPLRLLWSVVGKALQVSRCAKGRRFYHLDATQNIYEYLFSGQERESDGKVCLVYG